MRRPARWPALLLVIVLPIAVLWPLCRCDFSSWDDNKTVEFNAWFNPVTWHTVRDWWTTPKMDLYVPVTYTVWGAIAKVDRIPKTAAAPAHLTPAPFHIANLIVHVLTAIAVFQLLQLLLGKIWPAAVGSLLFALHPVQVETVAWISGLKDLLSAFFVLVAVRHYLLAMQLRRDRGTGWRWRYALSIVLLILALLSKPNAVVAPAITAVLDRWMLGRSWRSIAAWLAPWLVLSGLCIVEAKLFQPATGTGRAMVLYLRPLVAIGSLGFYLRKLIWPIGLAVDYGLRPIILVHSPWLVADAVLVGLVAIGLWLSRRKAPALAIGAAIFLIAVSPVLGLIRFDFQWYSSVADHYLYLPMFGVAIVAGWLFDRYRGIAASAVTAGVLLVLGSLSLNQTRYWKDTQTIFYHVIDLNPDVGPAYHQLALVAIEQENYDGAIELAKASIERRPESALGYLSYGVALWHKGENEQAAEQFYKALRAEQGSAEATEAALEDLAGIERQLQHYAIAEKLQRQVVSANPEDPSAHFDLGMILADEDAYPEAIRELEMAIRLDPYTPKYHIILGQTFADAGQKQAALHEYQAALRLDPNSHDAHMLINKLLGAHTP